MDNASIQKLVKISKMYHEQGMTQENIAKEFNMSRSAVSMALTEAKNNGIIQISIKDPSENNEELAARLEERFGLRKCFVVSCGTHNENMQLGVMTSQAARFAADILHSHSSIGLAWGNTCYEFMKDFPEDTALCDMTVVPLIGTSPLLTREFQLNESIRMFAEKIRGYPVYIYSPGFVDTLDDKKAIEESTYMRPILDLWQHLDYAIIGVGRIYESSDMKNTRMRVEDKAAEIRKCPDIAVGDICARKFNIRGEFVDNDYNRKLIGITGEGLMNTKSVIAMAVGSSKVIPIIGALRTKTIHYFIIDENTAAQVLNLLDSNLLPE